ncbi:MAG: hypothetical protein ACMUIU_07730 [bacterium]
MWATKEKIFSFLVIVLCMGILFSPARGDCVTLTGNILKTNNDELENALVFIYDFEIAKNQGLQGTGANIGIVATSVDNNNLVALAQSRKNIVLDEKIYPLDREYLLLISTLKMIKDFNYPSFFIGATSAANYSKPSTYVRQTRWWDVETLPRVKFTSGTFNLGTVIAPTGAFFRGTIKDNTGYLKDVGIELYYDSNGTPAQIPFPFTRFVRTSEPDASNLNFQIGGVLTTTSYYVRLIGNNKGYIDTFLMESADPNKPRKFTLTGNYNNPPYILTKKGATIWGYIKDNNNNSVKKLMTIQGLSDNEDEPYPLYYVHDPNYARFNLLTDAEKYIYRVEPYYYNYNSDGKYELKGLPYEDHDYYLSAIEMALEGSNKIYATPVWYDGNDNGTFDVNKARKISLSGASASVRVDFRLNSGACVRGYIDLEEEISDGARAVLENLVSDPNIFDSNKVTLVIEAFQVGREGTLSQIPLGATQNTGIGSYNLCGVPPGDYVLRSYGLNGFYPPEFYDNQTTYFTGEIISLDFGSEEINKNIDLSLGGMIEGRVTDSGGNAISDASVLVNQVNLGNPLVGYFFINSEGAFLAQYTRKTDSNGRFYFWGLPEGLYTIFVNGILEGGGPGYLPQFYTLDSTHTMTANQTSPIFITDNNPDFQTLNDFQLLESGEESGGIISGNISLASGVSSLVTLSSTACFIRLFKKDTGVEISNPLYWFGELAGNLLPYRIMVPYDGDYFISVQDIGLKLLPHYYRAGGATVNLNEASVLTISLTANSLTNKDIVLSKKSGTISGEVLDLSTNKGIAGMIVYASQEVNEGSELGTWRSIRQAETDSNGKFTLKGLYKGTYIFSVTDPISLYASRYYNTTGDPYVSQDAYEWNYDPDSSGTPPYITFNVQKGGRISGSVGSQFAGTKVYTYRVKQGIPVAGFSVNADPNFSFTGLIPGEYILGFKDPNLNYIPEYYSQSGFTTDFDLDNPDHHITVSINTTTWVSEMNFTQLGARVEGQIMQETGTSPEPMLNTYIFLYHLSDKKELWATTPAQFTATDSNGNYSLKGLSEGNYKIIAFGPQYRPISKYITIVESDLGSVKVLDLTFPVGWLNEKYDKTLTLEKGLNLIAYPTRIPPYVTGYTALSFLKDIVMVNTREPMTLKTISPYDQKWKSATFGNTELEGLQITDVHGSNYSISNGQGFLLYSEEGPTINFRYFPGQTSLWLKKGINLVGNVAFNTDLTDLDETDFSSDANFTTRKMLAKMGEDSSVSIQTFEAKKGKWQATYWMWGKAAGKDTKVEDELGYVVTMKEDVDNWYPANNN